MTTLNKAYTALGFNNIIDDTSYDAFVYLTDSEERCRQHLERVRFVRGDFCPHCRHDEIYRFKDGKRYRCASCRKDFTIKAGTISVIANFP